MTVLVDRDRASGPVLLFGRDPAFWPAAVAMVLSAFTSFIVDVPMDTQAAINAVAVALAGFLTAWFVVKDKPLPALLGVVQAVIVLAGTYGFDLSPEKQTALLGVVVFVANAYIRTQVTAPVPPAVVAGDGRHAAPDLP